MLIISLTAVGLILLAASINALVSLAKSAKHEITRLSAGETEKKAVPTPSGALANNPQRTFLKSFTRPSVSPLPKKRFF